MRPAVGMAALVASAVVGVAAGVGAHAAVPWPGPEAPPSRPSASHTQTPTAPAGTPLATFLGDANTFQIADMRHLGWRPDDVQVATAAGDAQDALTCQQQSISRIGAGINAMMNGYWSHVGSRAAQDESVDEILAQFSTIEQAQSMSKTIQGWFADCASLESDGGEAGPTQRITSPDADILWWRVEVGDGVIVHEGLVRGANRVALVAAYSPPTTDDQFVALMKAAARRLLA